MGTPLSGVTLVSVITGIVCFLVGGLIALKLGE